MKEIQLFGYAQQRLAEIQQRSQKKIDTAFERIKDQAKVRFTLKWQYQRLTSLCYSPA